MFPFWQSISMYFLFLKCNSPRLTQYLLRNIQNKVLLIVSYSRAGKNPEAPFIKYDSNLPHHASWRPTSISGDRGKPGSKGRSGTPGMATAMGKMSKVFHICFLQPLSFASSLILQQIFKEKLTVLLRGRRFYVSYWYKNLSCVFELPNKTKFKVCDHRSVLTPFMQ